MVLNENGRVHCNICGRETRHKTCRSYTRTTEDVVVDAGPVDVHETVEIMECLGCEQLVVRSTLEHDLFGIAVEFFPPPISRPMPRWKDKLPSQVKSLLEEVYRALQADSPRLATMGARTIVDLVIVDKVGDVGTFRQKLEELEAQGFVGGKNRRFLEVALDVGSAAAHRGLAPKDRDLNHVMDIVENLLEATYVLEVAAYDLRNVTPPRPQRRKVAPTP